jgi:hypothetical protein
MTSSYPGPAQDEDNPGSASFQPTPTNEQNINQLCDICKSIKFNLHFKHQCTEQNCPIELWYSSIISEPITVHSNVFSHHADFAALELSAQNGCHLCTLLSSSLARCDPESKLQFLASGFTSPQVSLVHGATMTGKSELLRVLCNGRSAELDMVDSSWTMAALKNLFAMFVATTHTAWRSPSTEAPAKYLGYPLLEYQPGDMFEVLHVWSSQDPLRERGEKKRNLWLARHCYDTEKPIGWIKTRHHTKTTNHPIHNVTRLPPVWEPCRLARRERFYLDMRPDSERIFSQIRSWANMCQGFHESCRHEADRFPPRILDVGIASESRDPFLVQSDGQRGQYLALSYRWGTSNTLRTTVENVSAHMDAIPVAKMPQTMQDAVTVARRLGQRYIWIDALCILQDSKKDWEIHASQMHKIFSNAWLVISADAAPDCAAGFLKSRNALEIASCEHPSLFQLEESAALPSKMICPRVPHAQYAVNYSNLSTRGWILQERLLARRTIHWSKYEVFWECNELDASERQPTKSLPVSDDEPSAFANWSELRKAVQPQVRFATHGPTAIKLGKTVDRLINRTTNDCWYQIVEEYSKRSLTQPQDRLPAISGLASAVRSHIKGRAKYVAGLWAVDLPQVLLWRREQTVQVPPIHSEKRDAEGFIAPSFSWAACRAPVIFNPVSARDVKFSVRVLGVGTTPRGSDDFGELLDGYVKIRGPIIALDTLHAQCPLASSPLSHGSGLFMDDPGDCLDLSGREILVLSVCKARMRRGAASSPGPFGRYACLLLSATAETAVYRRVGYYEPEPYLYRSALKKWTIQTLTII